MKQIKMCLAYIMLYLGQSVAQAQTFEEQRIVYPVIASDGQRIINGFQSFSNTDEVIYANALKWGIESYCTKDRDEITEVNIQKKSFTIQVTLPQMVAGKAKTTFSANLQVKVSEGKLVYNIYDVTYQSQGFLPLSSSNSLNNLNPDKKPKHKEIVNTFQSLASQMLNRLFDGVTEARCAKVEHWNDIRIQRPMKGMNEDECLLAFGKPANSFDSYDGRTQWAYNLNFKLIFNNHILETIIK